MTRRNLTKQEIIEEAIVLLELEGLDGLSMRKLAARLDVRAPTLYYHIPDKHALLNEVSNVLFERCFDRMPECETWQDWMLAFGEAIWEVQHEERFASALIMSNQIDEEHFQRSVDRVHAELSRFEADPERLFFVQSAIQAIMTGWSIFSNAAYADKLGKFVDFKAAAMNSAQALIDSWEAQISDRSLRKPQQD